VGNVITRHARPPDALALLVWSSLVPPIPLAGLSLALDGPARVGDALAHVGAGGLPALAYIVVASTFFGYGVWTWLLARDPASTVAPFTLLVPVVGITAAWLSLGERPNAAEMAGAAVVLGGLGLTAGLHRPLHRGPPAVAVPRAHRSRLLDCVLMSSRAPSEPRVPSRLTAVDLGTGGLHDELALDAVHVTGSAGEDPAARNVEFTAAHLQDVGLTGARLAHLALQDCRVTGGNLANVSVRGGVAQRTSFERVRLTGLAWHEGTIRDVTFTGCRIDLASFAASRLERVRFDDCMLAQSDLQDARLAAVVFDGCDLTELDFTGARLTAGCELRGCTLDGARGIERLRGAGMPVTDVIAAAGVFAAALGIRILGDECEDA
jgi:hypothetical protein